MDAPASETIPGKKAAKFPAPGQAMEWRNLFDNCRAQSCPAGMAETEKKSLSPVWLVIDLVVCAAFFVYIFGVVKTHVPSLDPRMITLWGAAAAACMTGVFWLAWQMVKVVYRFQTRSKN
jgi:hypothetical protein